MFYLLSFLFDFFNLVVVIKEVFFIILNWGCVYKSVILFVVISFLNGYVFCLYEYNWEDCWKWFVFKMLINDGGVLEKIWFCFLGKKVRFYWFECGYCWGVKLDYFVNFYNGGVLYRVCCLYWFFFNYIFVKCELMSVILELE